jgi:hypothetical protein
MKSATRLLYSCFIALLFPVTVTAQLKYYVATAAQGGNDANAGTSLSAPFATIAKAVSKATAPGDTVFVRSGAYVVNTPVKITQPGAAGKPIVITVYKPDMKDAGSRPVFDCSSMAVGGNNKGFVLDNAGYRVIYGIVIKGAGDNGMSIAHSNHVTIEFCSFLQNHDSGLQIGDLSANVTIINCDAYENADRGPGTATAGGNADGFAPKINVGDAVLFRGCRAWMNSDDGWDGYLRTKKRGGKDNVTTILEDCWAFRNGYYWLDGSTTQVQNGNGFKLGGSDTKDEAHNFVLIKCLSFYNKERGFDQNSNAGSVYLYNCSAYRNGGNDYALKSSKAIYKAGAELVLKNNMSLGAGGVNIPAESTPTRRLEMEHNVFLRDTFSREILSFDTTGVTGMRDVQGNLPRIKFMHLDAAAPAPHVYINKGVALPEVVYHGKTGLPASGGAIDIGAFEAGVDDVR